MIDSANALEMLRELGVEFYAGVPDSLLKNFCSTLQARLPADRHYIAANEGNAVVIACGYHLATGQIPLVYMQNSGLGNAVNPLASLAVSGVYNIPLLLLIGWRGEPGVPDEPQHVTQGRITPDILQSLSIPYETVPADELELPEFFAKMLHVAREKSSPVAMLVRKKTFVETADPFARSDYPLMRLDALQTILDRLQRSDIVIATTGKTSRELYEARIARSEEPGHDFLNVGAMGHAMQIAVGVALAKPTRQVFCLDGDGSLIMHMGGMAPLAGRHLPNFRHIVINNGAHESVGGHATAGLLIDLPAIAQACGYRYAARVQSLDALADVMQVLRTVDGPAMCEVRVRCGSSSSLGRPERTLTALKEVFMAHLANDYSQS